MTVRKLSDTDKRDILNLYRKPGETTSTLADRYGVSNSTISRLLKSTLPEDEYEGLISLKRAARTYNTDSRQTPLFHELEPHLALAQPLVEVETSPETAAEPSILEIEPETSALVEAQAAQQELVEIPTSIPAPRVSPNQNAVNYKENPPRLLDRQPLKIEAPILSSLDEDSGAQASALAQMLGEDLLDDTEDLSDDLDDEEDDDEEDDDEEDDDAPIVRRPLQAQTLVRVLPLSEATLPKTCYLVIDRASELITRPLREFGDLGQIPSQEFQQRTLPVFDNHRVARRFSTKRDRVIKIPDSRLLQKTRYHLQAKGITRLLVDGQVYSLSPTSPQN